MHYYQLLTIYVVFWWIYDGCHPHQGKMITDVSCCQMNACRVCILTDIYCLSTKQVVSVYKDEVLGALEWAEPWAQLE